MKILILGSAGMIGQKLVAKLLSLKTINEKKIQEIILFDVITTPKIDETDIKIQIKTGDFSDPTVSKNLVKDKPELIFHLAAIVSGHAEKEFDLGWNVNAKGSWNLFEAIRSVGQNYHPKLVFTSSLAVFGAPFPDRINDEFFTTPLTSYGSQKVVSELLLSDYSRKGMIDGISIRFPTICVRPGKPNLAASGFFSGIIREPLNGQEAILPVSTDTRHYFASPRSAIHFLIHAAELDTKKLENRNTLNMPGLSATVYEQIESLKRISGNEIVKLIKHKADADIQKIVGSWAKDIEASRAKKLGFKAETNFDEIIKVYIEEDLKLSK